MWVEEKICPPEAISSPYRPQAKQCWFCIQAGRTEGVDEEYTYQEWKDKNGGRPPWGQNALRPPKNVLIKHILGKCGAGWACAHQRVAEGKADKRALTPLTEAEWLRRKAASRA